MKHPATLTASLLLIAISAFGEEEKEIEFKGRFEQIVEAENMSPIELNRIWKFDEAKTHPLVHASIREGIKDAMLRGIKKIEIREFSIPEGTPKNIFEGHIYDYSLEPSKLVSITYSKKIEGTPFMWSWPLGESNGKLYFTDLTKFEPVDSSND